MSLVIENNVDWEIDWTVAPTDEIMKVSWWKEALLKIWMKLTLFKVVDKVITQREIIKVTSITGNVIWIERAVEPCPLNKNSTEETQTPLEFNGWDFFSNNLTAEDISSLYIEVYENIPETYATKLEVRKSELVYSASSTGDDDYEATIEGITTYTDWLTVRIKSDVANTWPATLNLNWIWAKAVKKNQWTAILDDWDWSAWGIATLVYNSTLDVWQYSSQNAVVISTADITWVIKQWAWASAPSGYFICDGSAISRTNYADLFAIIWTTYGVGDWSTTFNIPDLRGRVPVGKDSWTFSTLWGNWWAETVEHTHDTTIPKDWWGTPPQQYSVWYNLIGRTDWTSNYQFWNQPNNRNLTSGNSSDNNNLQPYLTINHIIKY